MFHKFKITTCAFILCLFGLTLMTVSPVFAEDSQEFKSCQQMKWKGGKKAKKNCFKDLASSLQADIEGLSNLTSDRGRQEEVTDLRRSEEKLRAEISTLKAKVFQWETTTNALRCEIDGGKWMGLECKL
jgi:peptidoglycan hydrolase CwlO-like protein